MTGRACKVTLVSAGEGSFSDGKNTDQAECHLIVFWEGRGSGGGIGQNIPRCPGGQRMTGSAVNSAKLRNAVLVLNSIGLTLQRCSERGIAVGF